MIAPTQYPLKVLAAIIPVSIIGGFLAFKAPLLGLGLATSVALISVGISREGFLTRGFILFLAIALGGYAFFGRAFAYLGAPPLFVGELLLALGVMSAILFQKRWAAVNSVPGWAILSFIVWGIICTVPHYATYRVDALRDAVVWGYAVFALLIIPLVINFRPVDDVVSLFSKLLPWFLVWATVSLVIGRLAAGALPSVPGTNVPVLALKPGDIGVHVAGIGAFLLLGLHDSKRRSLTHRPFINEKALWLLWLVSVLLVGSLNRGGLLAIMAAGFIVLLVNPGRSIRQAATVLAVIIPFALAIAAFDVSINLGGKRSISIEQIVANVQSISGDSKRNELSGSREWRLRWWDAIIDYTFRGPYFWTGKGYGINLADADGFQVSAAGTLRSPHNGHLTILARSGVPGLALWVILQLLFAGALISASIRARRNGREHWVAINGWILAYWAAFLINGAFDVFLEGPQGGIWFWCLMGFGIGILQIQREEIRDSGSNLKTVAP
jgi:hypothetical protein